jgi:hypothetical protein
MEKDMAEEPRSELHAQFVLTFAERGSTRNPVSEEELAELAKLLNTHLPASYCQFMRKHGPVYCPTILRLSVECGLEHPDLRQFLTPQQVLKKSRELWCQQLPVDLYVFANDCMGNAFCFSQSKVPLDDAPVLFLSRQVEELVNLGESFDELLRWYVEHIRQVDVHLAS